MTLKCEIPIIFTNNTNGAKHIFIDRARLPFYLGLRPADLMNLRNDGLVEPETPVKTPRPRINYPLLAQEYKKKLESGAFATRSDLAKSLGVSRAWISKVMRCLPRLKM